MKKLMTIAAVAAIAGSVFAAACTEDQTQCYAVFKITGSGKIDSEIEKGDAAYKTVQSLKIKKGYFVASQAEYAVYAQTKFGKVTRSAYIPGEGGWYAFGKNMDTLVEGDYKSGKSYSLESSIYFAGEGEDDAGNGIDLAAVAFGKVSVKITKGKSSDCGESTKACQMIVTPSSYKGWFVGTVDSDGDAYAIGLECTTASKTLGCLFLEEECPTDCFGGTFKLKYDKSQSGCKKYAEDRFAKLVGFEM